MNAKLERFFLIFLGVAFGGATVLLFIPKIPLLPIFSLTLFIVLSIEALGKSPFAFMMTGFTTLLGIFCMAQAGEENGLALPLLILTLWGGVFLLHLHHEKLKEKSYRKQDKQSEIN